MSNDMYILFQTIAYIASWLSISLLIVFGSFILVGNKNQRKIVENVKEWVNNG